MNWRNLIAAVAALTLIAVGMWLVRPAWACVALGGLLWVDLQILAWEQRHG